MTTQSHFTRRHERFFFLYGKTDDEFCLLPWGILRLEEALHRHLKELGYQRILCFNGRLKLYSQVSHPYKYPFDKGSSR